MLIPSSSKSWIGKYITLHSSKTNPTLGLRPRVGLVYSRESLYIFQSNFLNWMGLLQYAPVDTMKKKFLSPAAAVSGNTASMDTMKFFLTS